MLHTVQCYDSYRLMLGYVYAVPVSVATGIGFCTQAFLGIYHTVRTLMRIWCPINGKLRGKIIKDYWWTEDFRCQSPPKIVNIVFKDF